MNRESNAIRRRGRARGRTILERSRGNHHHAAGATPAGGGSAVASGGKVLLLKALARVIPPSNQNGGPRGWDEIGAEFGLRAEEALCERWPACGAGRQTGSPFGPGRRFLLSVSFDARRLMDVHRHR